jgi:hypothetical protein
VTRAIVTPVTPDELRRAPFTPLMPKPRRRAPLPFVVKVLLAEALIAVIECAAFAYLLSGISAGAIR